ncbi:MAG TPA: NF041680 family putative transposase [Streptosporangiaceae bacterium]|nr:NF041680 family putative transposase [Streptosporangiaceae bacterium]
MSDKASGKDHSRPTAALAGFRRALFGCLGRWADALFELCDASLCSSGPLRSVPGLSLEPEFRRSHGSLYKALALGSVKASRLRSLLVEHQPASWPMVFAVDASTWDRCDAETSPERGYYYSASKHSAGQPIVAGWSYQWISQLDWAPDSWTAPVDVARLSPHHNSTDATIEQVRRLVGLLPDDGEVALFVFDAGYDPIAIGAGLANERAQILVRVRSDRVFYPDPGPHAPGGRGRPRRHGPRFALADPRTWTEPDAQLRATDARYGNVTVQAWHGLHPKLSGRGRWSGPDAPPIVPGTVIRVEVDHLPKADTRAKKTLWLWWSGPDTPDLDLCWRAYLRRFDLEHTYRFVKNTLGWTSPSLQTPEQADRWTWLVVAAYTQLRLARGLVDDIRLPWERPRDPAQLTPTRVRRGFRRLRATIGTPASPPKSDTPGPGRPKGTARPPRTRYPAIKKAA